MWHPVSWAIIGAVVLVLAILLVQALFDRRPFAPHGSSKDLRTALVHGVLTAYTPAAYVMVLRGACQTLAALRPCLDMGNQEFDALEHRFGHPPRRGLLLAGCIDLVFALLGPALTEPGQRAVLEWWNSRFWSPEIFWHRVLGLVIGVSLAALGYAVVTSSAQLSRLARRLKPVDLFDLRSLAPFTRHGLNNGLLVVGWLSLFGLISAEFGITPMLLLALALSLTTLAVALVLPVRGAHIRIVQAKAEELAWCREALARERATLRNREVSNPAGHLADLAAYQALVDAVPAWPFNTATFTRLALYSVIPLGSWIASGLVQHVLEQWMVR